jgi:hypothetical protein
MKGLDLEKLDKNIKGGTKGKFWEFKGALKYKIDTPVLIFHLNQHTMKSVENQL